MELTSKREKETSKHSTITVSKKEMAQDTYRQIARKCLHKKKPVLCFGRRRYQLTLSPEFEESDGKNMMASVQCWATGVRQSLSDSALVHLKVN